MGESYGERLRLVFDVLTRMVETPLYSVGGVLGGGSLLVTALREGARNVYSYKPGGELVRLNRGPVYSVAEPPYGADRVVIARDVSRGRELVSFYLVRASRPGEEEPLASGLPPMRVLGIADKGDTVYITGADERGINIYRATPGGMADRLLPLPTIGVLLDADGRTGVGILFEQTGRTSLFVADLEEGRLERRPTRGSVAAARISPAGRVVYAEEGPDRVGIYESDPWSWDPAPLELAYGDLEEYAPRGVNYLSYTPRGELVVVARREGRSRIFLDGRDVGAPTGMHGAVYRLGDMLVATHTSLTTPPRVVAGAPGGEWRPLLEGGLPEQARRALAGSSFSWVETWDGSKMGVYTLESGYAGRPGPTVVLVHGGPFSEDADVWDVFAASLAVAGFNVVMPNYRGSTGYGEEWRLKIVGDPCGGELRDVLSAADWAERSGLASGLYIMGYSYGGYMTLCALTRAPGRFRAGVAGAAVADWEEMYELSDAAFRSFIELMFAGSKDREKWRERSPINYVDRITEPLCIVHSQNDTRTPLKPVLRLIDRATELGKSVEAHIAPDLGHAVNTVDDIVKLVLPAVLFLLRQEQHTGGRTGRP